MGTMLVFGAEHVCKLMQSACMSMQDVVESLTSHLVEQGNTGEELQHSCDVVDDGMLSGMLMIRVWVRSVGMDDLVKFVSGVMPDGHNVMTQLVGCLSMLVQIDVLNCDDEIANGLRDLMVLMFRTVVPSRALLEEPLKVPTLVGYPHFSLRDRVSMLQGEREVLMETLVESMSIVLVLLVLKVFNHCAEVLCRRQMGMRFLRFLERIVEGLMRVGLALREYVNPVLDCGNVAPVGFEILGKCLHCVALSRAWDSGEHGCFGSEEERWEVADLR